MEETAPARIRLTVDEARLLAERALQRIGYDAEETRIIADHVLDAALCGYEYSGLTKILNIAEDPRFRMPRQPMRVIRETAVSTLYDGGNNNGMAALYRATRAAIDKALARDIAVIGVANSWMSGRSAYYVEMIARENLIGMHTVCSRKSVAPPGGTRAVLGTNPIAFGLPTAHGPFVFDMGTSAIMGTDVVFRERMGDSLPAGVALDSDGVETRDPARARNGGALLPFGGYKGFGLGLVVQLFGILAGSALDPDRENSTLIIALKPDLLVPLEEFKNEAGALLDRVKETPTQAGVERIRIPGERSFANRERQIRAGIEIDRSVFEALSAL